MNVTKPKRLAALEQKAGDGQAKAAGRIVCFFLLMLALTLFARGMTGAALTQVEVVHPQSATVTESVRLTGQVESQRIEALTLPDGLTIRTVLVTPGQQVKEGDGLLEVETDSIAAALTQAQGELDKLNLQLAAYQKAQEADGASVESAQKSYDRAREDYQESLSSQNTQVERAQSALNEAKAEQSRIEGQIKQRSEARTALQTAVAELQDQLRELQAQLAELQTQPEESELEPQPEEPDNREAIEELQTQIAGVQAELERNTEQLAELDNQLSALETERESAAAQVKAARQNLEDAKTAASDSKRNGQRSVDDAQDALEQAKEDYTKAQQEAEEQNQQNQADAQILSVSIEQKTAELDALNQLQQSNGVLAAPYDGTILSLSGEAGGASDGAQLRLSAESDGYVLTLEGEELSQLTAGMPVTVKQDEQMGETQIAALTQGEGKSWTATAYLSGEGWKNGPVEVEAVSSSDYYELTVPIGAYHSDNNGSFVYVVEEETSVLGLRYVVRRESVTHLANNGTTVAVTGILSSDSNIVLSSNRSVQEGEQVRFGA